MRNRLLGFQPENGQQVLIRARVSLYPARGDFQLIAEHMEAAGDGALRRRFELLKHKLSEAGLFDAAHKKPLPALPERLGVITSPSGAAIRDILSVLKRRFPGIPILIYPVPVQGAEAPAAIVEALRIAGKRRDCDLLILARGGGSLEDLWAFNEEVVARAMYACPIPIVTGIGHEIDFTIADFVADARAPTPSAAAELISPDRGEWQAALSGQKRRLLRAWQQRLNQQRQALTALSRHLKHPGQRLREKAQRVDELEQRIRLARQTQMRTRHHQLATLHARLQARSPQRALGEWRLRLAGLQRAARRAMQTRLEQERRQLAALGRALDTVSPLATLGRGYAIVQTPDGRIIRQAGEVSRGDSVQARLGRGRLFCRVEDNETT
jgi:exodeoxyribonuclease VII large subunit